MKKYLIITVIILLGVIFAEYQQVKYANGKWETAEANVKAYAAQASDTEGKNTAENAGGKKNIIRKGEYSRSHDGAAPP